MKTITTIFLLLTALTVSAQQQSRATTWEEYNYLVSGQLNTILPGHVLRKTVGPSTVPFTDLNRIAEVFEFYRSYSSAPCALLIVYHKEGGSYHYFCVPDIQSGTQMWTAYNTNLNSVNDTGSALQTITYALSVYLASK